MSVAFISKQMVSPASTLLLNPPEVGAMLGVVLPVQFIAII